MISDLPTFAGLRERMRFLQSRQKLLSQNVANADTPGYKPKDMRQLGVDPASRGADQTRAMSATGGATSGSMMGSSGGVMQQAAYGMAMTSPRHIASSSERGNSTGRGASYETRPSGNAVDLENEMMKVSQNQIDFQTAANLYQRGLNTMKIALGKKA